MALLSLQMVGQTAVQVESFQFLNHAIGEKAAVETYGNGTLLIDSSSSISELKSISGDGQVILNNAVHINQGGVASLA